MILSSNHLFLTSAPEMREITKPLLSLGITYFGYCRYYNNGGRLYLCNNAKMIESYYANKLYRIGNTESQPCNYYSQVALWSTLPNQEVFEDSKQMGVDHGIFIIEPQKDSCEFFAFATTRENRQIINTYLTQMDFLKKFGAYFKVKAKSLIMDGEKNKIYLPYHNKKILNEINTNLSYLLEDECNNSNLTRLSKRQHDCAQLLLQGKTTKEIARHFSLSPRTIESYIDNLKLKLHCQNKTELILKLSEYRD